MKLLDVLLKAGSTALSVACPTAAPIIGMINSLLPADKQLPATATGQDVHSAIQTLPPDQQFAILTKQLDVEIADIDAWSRIVDSLAKADATGNSTRPWIAKWASIVVLLSIVAFMSAWVSAIVTNNAATLEKINGSHMTILALLGPVIAWVDRYFGKRTDEKKARYSLAVGQAPAGGALAQAIQAFRGTK
ncbi:MAG: hypothetical protein OEV73_00105 [Desulfobulbaceae bacterium]|nr:hypothetical protein [Desulfobulbaceae bacterium]